jgi:ATP-dependent RNA helicase DeaD
LPLICRRVGVTRNEVGAIRVGPTWSEFQIAGDAAQDFALAAARPDPRAPHVFIERSQMRGPRPHHANSNQPRTQDPRPHRPGPRKSAWKPGPRPSRGEA